MIVPAAVSEGGLLDLALPFHSGENAVSGEILRLQRHEQGGVCVQSVALRAAHAVGHDAAGLRGRGEHLAAGTHTEGVGAAVLRAAVERIVGGREIVAARRAVLRQIDGALPVLDPHAHGEGLRLHRDAGGVQGAEGVARAVPDGEDGAAGFDARRTVRRLHGQRREHAAFRFEPRDAVLKPHLAAERDHIFADRAHHFHEHIRSDVRLGVVNDVLRRAVRGELLQHPADALVMRVRVELAVGEGPGAALTELYVALGVEGAARAEGLHGLLTCVHVLSALEYDRASARFREQERGEHARRPEADHDRPLRAAC